MLANWRRCGLSLLLVSISVQGWAQDLGAELKDMTWVGFDYHPHNSRVFVHTTEPVQYSVDTLRDHVVVLTLDNTRVPLKNNTRELLTQYFDSPILRVEIKPIDDPSPSVQIEIHTRKKVTFKPIQKDTVLSLQFNH